MDEAYRRQVALLVRVLPHVATEPDFALKGGTAINLFRRDLPRLSVDIDLTWLPVADRAASLAGISAAMERVAARVERSVHGARVQRQRGGEGDLAKLLVRANGVQVKVEVTPVLRGTAYPPVIRACLPRTEAEFGFVEVPVVSDADLWAGKIVAALDRQHPRDLFDARGLLTENGLTDEVREALIVYLLSHDRPIGEVLAARRKDITSEFERNFRGMTVDPVELAELLDARERLVAEVVGGMPDRHVEFLASFERGDPDWSAFPAVPHAAELPAVRWKAQNLAKLSAGKRTELADAVRLAVQGARLRTH